jgi:hypothetical protein
VNAADVNLSLVRRLFPDYSECRRYELNAIMWHIEEGRKEAGFDWKFALPYVEAAYQAGLQISFRRSYRIPFPIPNDIAIEVCANSEKYPLALINLCEEALANSVGANVRQVGQIASDEQWFGGANSSIRVGT